MDEGVESTFYQDSDGDGYGSDTNTARGCEVPDGYTDDDGDCDDGDPNANPGEEDVGGDGVDADCNGVDDWTENPYEGTSYSGDVTGTLYSGSDSFDCEGTFSLRIRDEGAFDGSADCGFTHTTLDVTLDGDIDGTVADDGTVTGTWAIEVDGEYVDDLEFAGSIGGSSITISGEWEAYSRVTFLYEMSGTR